MYEYLVKRLRYCATDNVCEECPCETKPPSIADCIERTMSEAADAIEVLEQYEGMYRGIVGRHSEKMWEQIKSMPHWISIKEELPEELHVDDDRWSLMVRPSDDVLVYLQHEKRQTVAWYSWAEDTWTTVDECRCYGGTEISHWKRLGRPPVNETELLS